MLIIIIITSLLSLMIKFARLSCRVGAHVWWSAFYGDRARIYWGDLEADSARAAPGWHLEAYSGAGVHAGRNSDRRQRLRRLF